jgi:Peptidase family S41
MIRPLKYYPLFISFLLLWSHATAQQPCSCKDELFFVKEYIETNYAGFSDKVTLQNKEEYDAFTEDMLEMASQVENRKYCHFTIQLWLRFFQDDHIQFVSTQRKADKEDAYESISLTPQQIDELKSRPLEDIEGIYWSGDKTYKVALVENKTNFRDYVGVIIEAKTKLWQPGQIKFELKYNANDTYDCIYYMMDHSPKVRNYTIKDGRFNTNSFIKSAVIGAGEGNIEPFAKLEDSNKIVFFKDINDSTAYLRIKSFNASFANKIAKVITTNEEKLATIPYLILDIRYNGGGSDFAYAPLLPLIYTNPVHTVGVDVYATPGNIKAWQRALDDNPKLPTDVKQSLIETIRLMEENQGTMVSVMGDDIDTLTTVHPNPQKVAILVNEGCASSAEQFLLTAMQSKKVILMGQNTSGTLDYSNMRLVNLPCMPFILAYATTRSRRIPDNAIDKDGIEPDVAINFDMPWLEQVLVNFNKQE